MQLLPKLFRGTKQVHFHSSNIQVQDLGDFGQAPIFIMPQCERRALAEAEAFERARQPLSDLASEELVLGVRGRSRGQTQYGRFILGLGAFSPELPAARPQAVETSIDGDPGEPLAGIVQGFSIQRASEPAKP